MKEMKEEIREEKKMPKAEKGWSVESKAAAIRSSKMPESQKMEYLQEIGAEPKPALAGIPFPVYAKIRNIAKSRHSAMLAYPKAKSISLAALEEWDAIFKDF